MRTFVGIVLLTITLLSAAFMPHEWLHDAAVSAFKEVPQGTLRQKLQLQQVTLYQRFRQGLSYGSPVQAYKGSDQGVQGIAGNLHTDWNVMESKWYTLLSKIVYHYRLILIPRYQSIIDVWGIPFILITSALLWTAWTHSRDVGYRLEVDTDPDITAAEDKRRPLWLVLLAWAAAALFLLPLPMPVYVPAIALSILLGVIATRVGWTKIG